MFNNIQKIYQLNSMFLRDLESQCAHFENKSVEIGAQILKFCSNLQPYLDYCDNYENAMLLLDHFKERNSFNQYCRSREKRNDQPLQALLMYVPTLSLSFLHLHTVFWQDYQRRDYSKSQCIYLTLYSIQI